MEGENGTNLKEIENLMVQGVDINCLNKGGLTPLLYLVKKSNEKQNLIDVLQLLLHHGADIKATGNDGLNALLYLCQKNQKNNLFEIIRLLIKQGIDVRAKNLFGLTAMNITLISFMARDHRHAVSTPSFNFSANKTWKWNHVIEV